MKLGAEVDFSDKKLLKRLLDLKDIPTETENEIKLLLIRKPLAPYVPGN